MGQIDRLVLQAAKGEIRADVAVDHEKGVIAEHGQRLQNTATGFKRLGFPRITDMSPKGFPIPERSSELMAKVCGVNDDFINAARQKVPNQVNDEWLPTG